MKKLRLDLEKLAVNSFATEKGPAKRFGTVRGYATTVCTEQFACTWPDCGGGSMLADSCGASCGSVCGPPTVE